MVRLTLFSSDNYVAEVVYDKLVAHGYRVRRVASGRLTPVVRYGRTTLFGHEEIMRYFSL